MSTTLVNYSSSLLVIIAEPPENTAYFHRSCCVWGNRHMYLTAVQEVTVL